MYVIYRFYAGENQKGRPPYYSKRLALASFVRAVRQTPDLKVIFLHDGPVPEDIRQVMAATGELLPVMGGSNRRSYIRAVQLPRLLGWDADSFVFFSEDDYLYLPDALSQLQVAVDTYRQIDYFTTYTIHRLEHDALLGEIDGLGWEQILSTTSTFGGRVRVVKEDERLLTLCPYSGGAWDYATCLAYQGERPYEWADLWQEATFRGDVDALGAERPPFFRGRLAARAVARGVVNLRANRRQEMRKIIAAPVVNIATHLETEFLAEGHDWAAIAAETAEWAQTEGLPFELAVPVPVS